MYQLHGLQKPVSGLDAIRESATTLQGITDKDLLIYINIPFCNSKCVFCDWVADIPVKDLRSGPEMGKKYTEALCKQMRISAPELNKTGYIPKHIYWGGGTPSRLDTEEIIKIISTLKECFDLHSLEQHMMETSPETLTLDKLEAMRSAGVRRISVGIQSFHDVELRRAARSHSADQAKQAVELVRKAGFEDYNLDLIAALPGQSLEMLEYSLRTAIELQPTHVSIYVYRPDPRTVMAKQSAAGSREKVHVKKIFDYYDRAREMLKEAGYYDYTTCYFVKDSKYRFRGETYYYELLGDYIGFGSGAYSVLGHRYFKNMTNLHSYLENPLGVEMCEVFNPSRTDRLLSLMGGAMLTSTGVNYERFERICGFPFQMIRHHPAIEESMLYYQECGAKFEETDEALRVTAETRSKAHLTLLSRSPYWSNDSQ